MAKKITLLGASKTSNALGPWTLTEALAAINVNTTAPASASCGAALRYGKGSWSISLKDKNGVKVFTKTKLIGDTAGGIASEYYLELNLGVGDAQLLSDDVFGVYRVDVEQFATGSIFIEALGSVDGDYTFFNSITSGVTHTGVSGFDRNVLTMLDGRGRLTYEIPFTVENV